MGIRSSDRRRFYFDALSDAEIDQLSSPWLPETAVTIVKHLGRVADYSRRAAVPAALRLLLGLAILGALAVWVMMLALPLLGWMPAFNRQLPPGRLRLPTPAMACGFSCCWGRYAPRVHSARWCSPCAASARERVVTSQKVAVDAVLGVAAGFLTAALYMLAQITITGRLDLPSTTADYSRVALVVSMAAVFASLYLDAAFSRFDLFKDSVMSGAYGKKPEGK